MDRKFYQNQQQQYQAEGTSGVNYDAFSKYSKREDYE